MIVNAQAQLKSFIALKGITQKQLVEILTKKTNRKYTSSSLSKRLSAGTITYNEMMIIADLLGFEVSYNFKNLDK